MYQKILISAGAIPTVSFSNNLVLCDSTKLLVEEVCKFSPKGKTWNLTTKQVHLVVPLKNLSNILSREFAPLTFEEVLYFSYQCDFVDGGKILFFCMEYFEIDKPAVFQLEMTLIAGRLASTKKRSLKEIIVTNEVFVEGVWVGQKK